MQEEQEIQKANELAWLRMQAFNATEQMQWFDQRYCPKVDFNKVLTLIKAKSICQQKK